MATMCTASCTIGGAGDEDFLAATPYSRAVVTTRCATGQGSSLLSLGLRAMVPRAHEASSSLTELKKPNSHFRIGPD